MSNKERFNRSISLTKKQGRLDRAHKPLHSKLTQYEINGKYRRRVHDFNRAIVDVFKANKHRYKISKEKY